MRPRSRRRGLRDGFRSRCSFGAGAGAASGAGAGAGAASGTGAGAGAACGAHRRGFWCRRCGCSFRCGRRCGQRCRFRCRAGGVHRIDTRGQVCLRARDDAGRRHMFDRGRRPARPERAPDTNWLTAEARFFESAGAAEFPANAAAAAISIDAAFDGSDAACWIAGLRVWMADSPGACRLSIGSGAAGSAPATPPNSKAADEPTAIVVVTRRDLLRDIGSSNRGGLRIRAGRTSGTAPRRPAWVRSPTARVPHPAVRWPRRACPASVKQRDRRGTASCCGSGTGSPGNEGRLSWPVGINSGVAAAGAIAAGTAGRRNAGQCRGTAAASRQCRGNGGRRGARGGVATPGSAAVPGRAAVPGTAAGCCGRVTEALAIGGAATGAAGAAGVPDSTDEAACSSCGALAGLSRSWSHAQARYRRQRHGRGIGLGDAARQQCR